MGMTGAEGTGESAEVSPTVCPNTCRAHAEDVACHAAYLARLAGADVDECAAVHARTYAAALEG